MKVLKFTHTRDQGSMDCDYETNAGASVGETVPATQIRYLNPVASSEFASQRAYYESEKVPTLTIGGLGTRAYVATGTTPFLYVLEGTMQITLVAPRATTAELVALARIALH